MCANFGDLGHVIVNWDKKNEIFGLQINSPITQKPLDELSWNLNIM